MSLYDFIVFFCCVSYMSCVCMKKLSLYSLSVVCVCVCVRVCVCVHVCKSKKVDLEDHEQIINVIATTIGTKFIKKW